MPATDLELLVDSAQEAGRIASRYWRKDPEVWDKGSDGPVSEADIAVDRFLRERLLSERPDYGWSSEETEDDLSRLAADRVFIVDPIDGTRSFLNGEKTWAHSLAVVERGRVTAACVFLPLREKLYAAAEGEGATLNGETIRVSTQGEIANATVLCPRVTLDAEHWKEPPPALQRYFRPSLAYRLALVAEGRFDAMITLRDAWEWDIAAGALIIEEAGGAVTNRLGRPIDYNDESRKAAGVIAANPGLARGIHEALA